MPLPRDRNKYGVVASTGEYHGNRAQNRKQYNESPSTYKTDRQDRLFDTEGFKRAIEEAGKIFKKKTNRVR